MYMYRALYRGPEWGVGGLYFGIWPVYYYARRGGPCGSSGHAAANLSRGLDDTSLGPDQTN